LEEAREPVDVGTTKRKEYRAKVTEAIFRLVYDAMATEAKKRG